jgi:hypothetical protein
MKQSEFQDKVNKKLDDKEVNDYVDSLENQPKELSIDIPDNPFDEVEDDKDEYESDELTYKQNLKFRKYLDKLGYTDFSEWWDKIGKDKMDEMYTEEISMNFKEGDILHHWDIWIQNNMDRILD